MKHLSLYLQNIIKLMQHEFNTNSLESKSIKLVPHIHTSKLVHTHIILIPFRNESNQWKSPTFQKIIPTEWKTMTVHTRKHTSAAVVIRFPKLEGVAPKFNFASSWCRQKGPDCGEGQMRDEHIKGERGFALKGRRASDFWRGVVDPCIVAWFFDASLCSKFEVCPWDCFGRGRFWGCSGWNFFNLIRWSAPVWTSSSKLWILSSLAFLSFY